MLFAGVNTIERRFLPIKKWKLSNMLEVYVKTLYFLWKLIH